MLDFSLLCSAGQASGGQSRLQCLCPAETPHWLCPWVGMREAAPAEKAGFGPGGLNRYLMETGYLGLKNLFPRITLTKYHRSDSSKQENSVFL